MAKSVFAVHGVDPSGRVVLARCGARIRGRPEVEPGDVLPSDRGGVARGSGACDAAKR